MASSDRPYSDASVPPFEQIERLLWKLLGKLATRGYVVPPSDAQDVIHDFYVYAWPQLLQRFDPSRGAFNSYLASAFYRYGRHRIVQLQAWRRRLQDVTELAERSAADPLPEDAAELAQIRAIVDRLDEPGRTILLARLEGRSERDLERSLNLSRHRQRELLIDALGRVGLQFGGLSAGRSIDGRVAESLWRDDRTIADTALQLGVSVADVRASRLRNVARIAGAIKKPSQSRRTDMPNDLLQLVKSAMLGEVRPERLDEIRRHAADIRILMEDEEIEFSSSEVEMLAERSTAVAAVYEALAGEAIEDDQADEAISREIESRFQSREQQIGEAFAAALETLPDFFHDWRRWFGEIRDVPSAYREHLSRQLNVQAGGPFAAELIEYGLTPAIFVAAGRGIELMASRLLRVAATPTEDDRRQTPKNLVQIYRQIFERTKSGELPSLVLTLAQESEIPTCVPREMLISQVRGTPSCPPEAVEPLAHWLLGAARHKPFLFAGFEVKLAGRQEIRLVQQPVRSDHELLYRWTWHGQEARVAAASLAPA